MKLYGLERELTVKLDRNIGIDALSYLNQPTKRIPQRRYSVAGSNVFRFGDNHHEAGFDYFGRVPRSNRVNVGPRTNNYVPPATAMVQNHQNDSNDFGVNISGSITQAPFADDASTSYTDDYTDYTEYTDMDFIYSSSDEKELDLVLAESMESTIAMTIEPLFEDSVHAAVDSFDPFGEDIESLFDDSVRAVEPNETNAFGWFDTDGIDSYHDQEATLKADQKVAAAVTRPQLFNDFHPFQRVRNLPFAITGRPRAISVDSHFTTVSNPQPPQPVDDEEGAQSLELQMVVARVPQRRPRRLSIQAIPRLYTIEEYEKEDGFGDEIEELFR